MPANHATRYHESTDLGVSSVKKAASRPRAVSPIVLKIVLNWCGRAYAGWMRITRKLSVIFGAPFPFPANLTKFLLILRSWIRG